METTTHLPLKNNKKVIQSWALFDWANSAYSLVISTAVFPVYFVKNTPEVINIWGFQFSNNALYSFAVSFSYIIIAALSPILSGMADYSGKRLFFLKLFTILGAINCSLLYFFKGEPQLWMATSAFILGTIGFAGSLVFYDSYLPLIATKDQYDKVSAKGYSYGYIGSVILLIFVLVMIQRPQWFRIEDEKLPARIGFLLVGLWWFFWSQYTFKNMPPDTKSKINFNLIFNGYNEIKEVYFKAMKNNNIVNYLLSFFLFSAGVQTVIYLATIFAEKELKMETSELILVVLIIQLIAILGSYLFARVSEKIGNVNAMMTQIIIWIIICFIAYNTHSKEVFYLTAAFVGMVLGGIQSLARATYSKILEKANYIGEDLTSFFSLSDVLYKLSVVSGTFIFGFVTQLTGNMRYSVLTLGILFLTSIFFIKKIKLDKE
jgi:UMF1 family MFS transporter